MWMPWLKKYRVDGELKTGIDNHVIDGSSFPTLKKYGTPSKEKRVEVSLYIYLPITTPGRADTGQSIQRY
ncbi:hypothetical protein SAMN05216436_108133 [bacterium A37T11]|nr:hypothetical protein SAMN05216436_108133 [bacterium A37T11]